MPTSPLELPALPQGACGHEGAVFAEPWQAQAFALAVRLSQQGLFTWTEWADVFSRQLVAAARRGEPDDGSRYYEHWLAALEELVTVKGLTDAAALSRQRDAWEDAYRRTPHGQPVALSGAPATLDRRWLLAGLGGGIVAFGLVQASQHPFDLTPAGLAASAAVGTMLGMRHALEPDHLAAISTLLTGERDVRRAAWLGVHWGIGHTLTLLVAGSMLVLLRAEVPPVLGDVLGCAVSLLLIGFGVRAVRLSAAATLPNPTHTHTHGAGSRSSLGGLWTSGRRPLVVGAVHGLAGTGVLTALVMAELPTMASRIAYLALFGLGSTVGMAALSGLLGWPLARVGTHGAVARGIGLAAGCISIALGLYWGYPLVDRLVHAGL